jgi:hypothetical protein
MFVYAETLYPRELGRKGFGWMKSRWHPSVRASPRPSMILAFSERPCVSPNVLSTLFLFENHPGVFRDDLQSQDMSSTGTVGELRVYRWARGGHLLIHDVFDGIATFH